VGNVFLMAQEPAGEALGAYRQGEVDIRLNADHPPESTTVKAALYTGRSPLEVTGRHRRGRPDEALAAFIRTHTLLRAEGVWYANAHRPDAFRQPPTPVMLAAEGAGLPIRTLGHLRRGEALAPDVTGAGLVARGHADVPVLTVDDAASRVAEWVQAGYRVVMEVERTTPPAVMAGLAAAMSDRGIPWLALVLPGEGVVPWPDGAWVAAGHRISTLPHDVTGLLVSWWSA
jgi:hypothetical protein